MRSERILVLGRGAVGLATAIRLAEEGHEVTCIGRIDRLPSSQSACALFLPYFGTENRPEHLTWAQESWGRFREISNRPDAGVQLVSMMELFREPRPAPVSISQSTYVRSIERTDLPHPFRYAWEFDTWLIEMGRYLPYLEQLCSHKGIELTYGDWPIPEIGRFSCIVNCMGVWASQYFAGLELIPVRGQLIVVDCPRIGLAVGADEFLIAPRSDGTVVGALWQIGDTVSEPRAEDTRLLLNVLANWLNSDLLGSRVAGAMKVLAVQAGVRPYRAAGALVGRDVNSLNVPVIHNVGHGGSGVAMSWGCAEAVRSLI